jgi:ubiquinone/menaquinone biosynthesis C-methylase UbiE
MGVRLDPYAATAQFSGVSEESQPHSAEHFGEQRDFWWHRDFLDLMARRWKLAEAGSLADIGCGLCHWSRLLYPYLQKPARLAGVDREEHWVNEGRQKFLRAFPEVSDDLVTFVRGEASDIPLPEDSFDVVTCQTVLMHLADPKAALREMARILRPGGLLICVEPNNLWNYLAFTSTTESEPVETLTRRFEFWLRYHRGKKLRGAGDHSIGDLLPGYVAELGLAEIQVYQSDRAAAVFPPYATREQRAILEEERRWKSSGQGPWDKEAVRRDVLLGGGSEELFEAGYRDLVEQFETGQRALEQGRFHAAYGSLTYLVSGRKPAK